MTRLEAERVIAAQCGGLLLPSVELPFDDPDLSGCTVADVLADPLRFAGETLADPVEGVAYGRGKAKVMRRSDGTPWIHSFAHGRTTHELKYDYAAVRRAIEDAPAGDAFKAFCRLRRLAELDAAEEAMLRELVVKRSSMGARAFDSALRGETARVAAKEKPQERERKAERNDARPQIDRPRRDAPWLEVMAILNSGLERPFARDIDDVAARVCLIKTPDFHAFSDSDANDEE